MLPNNEIIVVCKSKIYQIICSYFKYEKCRQQITQHDICPAHCQMSTYDCVQFIPEISTSLMQ